AARPGWGSSGRSVRPGPAGSVAGRRTRPEKCATIFRVHIVHFRQAGLTSALKVLALVRLGVAQQFLGDLVGRGPDRLLDGVGDVGVGLEEVAHVLAALADALAVVGEPAARLLDDAGLDAEVDDLAQLGDALAVHDVEDDLAERRGDLVLDHLHPGGVADHLVAVLDRARAADVETDRGVELQRIAAGSGLGRAVHDADLVTDLVDEQHDALRL